MNKQFKGGNLLVSERAMGAVINKILIIRFDDKQILKSINFPALRRISISVSEKEITVFLQSELLRDYFNRFIDMFCDSVNSNNTSEEVLALFLDSIDKIKTLLELDSRISEQVRKGLWGELILIMKMLEDDVDQREVIEGWHGPSGAIHDFNYQEISYEVKTHSRTARAVHISNEFQLLPNGSEEFKLILVMAETIRGTGIDSLQVIYHQILDLLRGEFLKRLFREKCSEIGDGYAGRDSGFYDSRYNLLSISAFEADHADFPRISDIPTGISDIKYSLDISSLDKFYNPNFKWTV